MRISTLCDYTSCVGEDAPRTDSPRQAWRSMKTDAAAQDCRAQATGYSVRSYPRAARKAAEQLGHAVQLYKYAGIEQTPQDLEHWLT